MKECSTILYYNFTPIDEVKRFCADQRRKCKELNLLGRVYVSDQGINGTLAGEKEDIDKYKEFLTSLLGFTDTQFKEDILEHIPFVKLIVKIRPEIVTLKAPFKIDPKKDGGVHLSPQAWKQTLESGEDITLIDVRNNYETKIGHFEGAIRPDVENFYDFGEWVDQANLPKDKKVLMYCTGGIRCEVFSGYMKKQGFNDVCQLDGGIINYAKTVGGDYYKGKCFVFDDRLVVPIEKDQKEPLTKCEITGEPCDMYLNCANPDCNKLFICSPEGAKKMEGCCSAECLAVDRRRPFDPENIYEPTRKWYTYGNSG